MPGERRGIGKSEPYLGYGSPEALEAALREKDAHFEVVLESLCFLTVCSDLPQDEVVARMRKRPSGTSGGWQLSDEPTAVCLEKPTHKHYLFEA